MKRFAQSERHASSRLLRLRPGVPMHFSQQTSVTLATVCCICALTYQSGTHWCFRLLVKNLQSGQLFSSGCLSSAGFQTQRRHLLTKYEFLQLRRELLPRVGHRCPPSPRKASRQGIAQLSVTDSYAKAASVRRHATFQTKPMSETVYEGLPRLS